MRNLPGISNALTKVKFCLNGECFPAQKINLSVCLSASAPTHHDKKKQRHGLDTAPKTLKGVYARALNNSFSSKYHKGFLKIKMQ